MNHLLALLALSSPAPKIEVIFTPVANLTYQLDIVTDQLSRDPSANIYQLWNERFLKSEEDRAMLQRWKANRTELRQMQQEPLVSKVRFPIEFVGPRTDHESLIRGAGFDALNASDYANRIRREAPR